MLKGEAKTKYQREYMRRWRAGRPAKPGATKTAETKPSPAPDTAKDQEIAQLKARIRAVEQERDHYKQLAESGAQHVRQPEAPLARDGRKHAELKDTAPATTLGPNAQISKFIRHLGNANEAEATAAARKLVSVLAASASDRHDLADVWEKHCEEQARQRPPKPKPVDWPEVEIAIKTYTEGKTKVNINAVNKAVYAHMPKAQHEGLRTVEAVTFLRGCLRRLGFRRRGEFTHERTAPTN
jgi:hypothetical protein